MDPHPDGPSEVFEQLQLPLEGVEPLTAEQMLDAWIQRAEVDADDVDLITAYLYKGDRESRRRRAARWRRILAIESKHSHDWGQLVHGGQEAVWLLDEAAMCLAYGLPLGALLCSHAACERHLAGLLSMVAVDLPPAWIRWGLGRLVQEAGERDLLTPALMERLYKVNETRKVSAHFKPPMHEGTLWARASSGEFDFDLTSVATAALEDAFEAFDVAAEVIRCAGWPR